MSPAPNARGAGGLVVFLGPSLSRDEANALVPAQYLPPARQGDVWRALSRRPAAIALVDGVFEAQPSVWHREILAALDAGVAVFGGASMGALRAAELQPYGMVGVGTIFGWYRDGKVVDDSEVALLHAGADLGYQAFTVPLVNVRHAAERARSDGILSRSEAQGLVAAAAAVFYQERTWEEVVARAASAWRRATRVRWDAWAALGVGDLKADDARRCLRAAGEYVAAVHGAGLAHALERSYAPSSLVRRRRLLDGESRPPAGAGVRSSEVLSRLRTRPGARDLAELGLRSLLLVGWARELGLRPSASEIARAERTLLRRLGGTAKRKAELVAQLGLDAGEWRTLCAAEALEERVLADAPRLLNDGPSLEEGLAHEARRTGSWLREVKALFKRAKKRSR